MMRIPCARIVESLILARLPPRHLRQLLPLPRWTTHHGKYSAIIYRAAPVAPKNCPQCGAYLNMPGDAIALNAMLRLSPRRRRTPRPVRPESDTRQRIFMIIGGSLVVIVLLVMIFHAVTSRHHVQPPLAQTNAPQTSDTSINEGNPNDKAGAGLDDSTPAASLVRVGGIDTGVGD